MLKVYTSQYRYKGKNRLDITVKSGIKAFAPTWDMVMAYKNKELDELRYTTLYGMLMDESREKYKKQWDELLSKDEVVLVCFCRKGEFCHRILLANMLVNWFDCEYLVRLSCLPNPKLPYPSCLHNAIPDRNHRDK